MTVSPVRLDDRWWAVAVLRDIAGAREAQQQILEHAGFSEEGPQQVLNVSG